MAAVDQLEKRYAYCVQVCYAQLTRPNPVILYTQSLYVL